MTAGFPTIPMTTRSISDVMYMRFTKKGKVVRVARAAGGDVLALYPSRNKSFFYGEAFYEPDDESPRTKVRKSEIKDKVWLRLLEGVPITQITKNYETFADNYSFCRRWTKERDLFKFLNAPTFDITEQEEKD